MTQSEKIDDGESVGFPGWFGACGKLGCCCGCRHNIPGDCAARRADETGYMRFPEGNCYEATTNADHH